MTRPPGRWLVALLAAVAALIAPPSGSLQAQRGLPFPGDDFTLTLADRHALLTWQGGTATVLRLLVGYNPEGGTARDLPVTATSATDEIPPSVSRACYMLAASRPDGSQLRQRLCAWPGVGAGRRPSPFLVQLMHWPLTNPSLAWAPVGTSLAGGAPGEGVAAYLLLTIPEGAPYRFQVLPPTTTSVTAAPIGSLVCYLVAVVTASGIVGWTDVVCADGGLLL